MARYMFFLILVLFSGMIFPRMLNDISIDSDQFYHLDGFNGILIIYNLEGSVVDSIDLKKVSDSFYFDSFRSVNKLNSYLFDSFSGMLFLVDENIRSMEFSNISEKYNRMFSKDFFILNYNSLLLSTTDLTKIFTLENGILDQMISLPERPLDIYYDQNVIYILYKDKVTLYSSKGIVISTIPIEEKYEYISVCSSNGYVYVLHDQGIDLLSYKLKSKKHLDPAVIDGILQKTIFFLEDTDAFLIKGKKLMILKNNSVEFLDLK